MTQYTRPSEINISDNKRILPFGKMYIGLAEQTRGFIIKFPQLCYGYILTSTQC